MIFDNVISLSFANSRLLKADSLNNYFNAIGSTVAMTDQTETIVNSYAYTPFGIITNESESIPQPFKYVGQYGVMHEPNGFYYMRARYYDPQVGRFVSEDPIGFEGGTVNLYEYARNNPINWIDPLGLTGIVPIDPSKGCPPGKICLDPGPYDPDAIPAAGLPLLQPLEPDLNPNGLTCKLVCGLGGGLVGTAVKLAGAGAVVTIPITVASYFGCKYICPPPLQCKE